ncbi:MAG: hypothetical protein JW940_13655, partial [Polyangiaceae bacterium]|nr:hypothetical protein [Polyangiaceae bacterium]
MRIKLAVLAALLLTPVLASCTSETEHATAVGRVSANLQAKVSADAGESGAYWFEYRQAGASTWIQTTHRNWSVGGDVDDLYLDEALRPSCGSASNCTQATLTSRTTYEYRFCGTVNGNGPVCQDSDSASDPPTTYDRFTTNWNTGLMEPFAGELAVDSAEDTEGGRALDVDGGSDGDAAGLANGANGMRRYPFNSDPSGRNGGVLLTGPFRKAVIHVYKQQESGSPNFGHYVAETIAGNLDNTLPMPPFGTSTTPAKQTHLPGPHQAVGLQNGGILITDLFHARVHYVTPPSQG